LSLPQIHIASTRDGAKERGVNLRTRPQRILGTGSPETSRAWGKLFAEKPFDDTARRKWLEQARVDGICSQLGNWSFSQSQWKCRYWLLQVSHDCDAGDDDDAAK